MSKLYAIDDDPEQADWLHRGKGPKPERRFDPDQPRDEQGQWTSGGGTATAGPISDLHERIAKPDGGFTYQPVTDEQPSAGFAVSPYPGRSFAKPAGEFTAYDLIDYINANGDMLVEPKHYLGAWHDPASDKVFLDISVVSSSADEAASLCRDHDQIAYFDLQAGKSITVNADATSGGAAL